MQNLKVIGIAVLAALGLGYGIGRYVQSPRIETKIEEREVIKTDVVTVIKESTNKDGTVVKETVIKDNSVKKSDKEKSELIITNVPQWRINGAYDINNRSYMLGVDRRVLGPIFIGAGYNTVGSVYVGVSVEF